MAKVKRKDLGKGIKALLSDVDNNNSDQETVNELSGTVAEIPIDQIEVNPYQPRNDFDEQALNDLAQSIKVHGLIQPITVRRLGLDKYQIISGERRFRASQMAGLKQVPTYIRLANDQEMIEMALVENIQRQDLNAIEVAITYQRLMDECDLTHEALSERVGKNRSTVTNYVRLLKLPPQIQSSIKLGEISMGHARALISIDNIDNKLYVFNKITHDRLSVRETENLVKKLQQTRKSQKPSTQGLSPDLKRVQENLMDKFATGIKIQRSTNGKGKIVINFDSDDSLNYILDILND